jgi:hypothetical protein
MVTFRSVRQWIGDLAFGRALGRVRDGVGSVADFNVASKGLINLSRLNEAESILQQGLSLYPDDFGLLVQNAWLASFNGNHVEAKKRWLIVKERKPGYAHAWCQVAFNARVLSEIEESSSVITEALRRFPRNRAVISEAARVADRRAAFSEAIILWEKLFSSFHAKPEYIQGYAYDLVRLRRLDEADAVLAIGNRRFPLDRGLLATQGALSMAREDWEGAIAIWQNFRSQYPDDQAGWENLGLCFTWKYLADLDKDHDAKRVAQPVDVPRIEDEATRKMLLCFESVGSDCEFGMVQRRYGAEPLGLLRWNYVSFESLMAGLSARFAGMGDAENTEFWNSNDGEYFIQDKRWGLAMHTFMFSSQVDKDVLFPKLCKRIIYLRDKLITEIKVAEKTIVFKSNDLSLDQMLSLHKCLRTLGPVRLLCVKVADEDPVGSPLCGKPGEIFEIQDDLFVGFIGRLGGARGYWDIAFNDWISICRNIDRAPARHFAEGGA